jgi:hypothetical protein
MSSNVAIPIRVTYYMIRTSCSASFFGVPKCQILCIIHVSPSVRTNHMDHSVGRDRFEPDPMPKRKPNRMRVLTIVPTPVTPPAAVADLHSSFLCLRFILRSVRAPFEAVRQNHFSAPAMRNSQLHQARLDFLREPFRSTCNKLRSETPTGNRARPFTDVAESRRPAVLSPTIVASLFSFAKIVTISAALAVWRSTSRTILPS